MNTFRSCSGRSHQLKCDSAGIGGSEREIMVHDVSRVYFYAKMTRPFYIEIPPEDPNASPDMLGRLRLCLYGTRDAALNWQQALSDHLV